MSDDSGKISAAERREVRRAIAEGRPVSDPRLRACANSRTGEAAKTFRRVQENLEGPSRRRLILIILLVIGLAVLLSGLSPANTPRIVIGAVDMGLAAILLLLEPVARRGARRLTAKAARAKRLQKQTDDGY